MTKKKMITTNFAFSYGFLKQLADSTVALVDRDLTQFTDRGFTAAKRTELVNAIAAFASFSTDEQMTGLMMTATANKTNARNILERQMRTFFQAASNVFGEYSGAYREFGNPEISRQTDAELVRNARMMAVTATKYVTNLAGEGITAAKITALDTAKTALDTNIDLQTAAINNRDNSTEQRAVLANTLYALIVRYSDTGKDIWYEDSEAKYNDYVIYNTVSGTVEDLPSAADMGDQSPAGD